MAIIFLLPWLEELEKCDSCTEKCCLPIMRGSDVQRKKRHTNNGCRSPMSRASRRCSSSRARNAGDPIPHTTQRAPTALRGTTAD